MAGLFDFKSAEDILKERQDATRKNVMEAFNQPGQYKVRGERTANAVGKILGLLGGQLFADSPEEQVAGKMQRANQLAESLKPVEGESQSDFYNRVAVSFNDAGYTQNSLRALTLAKQAEEAEAKEAQRQKERNELTEYQQRVIKLQEEKDKREAASKREVIEDVNKRKRFLDTGELVFPDVEGEEDTKAPTTRTIYDGKNRVNQEWDSKTASCKEVGRGQPDSNAPTVVVNNANTWSKLDSAYQRDTKNVREGYIDLTKVKAALGTKGGAANQAIQASLAQAFGGSTRAVAELEKWATFGNLPERVTNSINKFFAGDYTETARKDVLRLIRSHEKLLAEQHRSINERFTKVGNSNKVDPSTFLIDVPDVNFLDFSSMDASSLAGINVGDLDPIEREELENRLDELGL